MSDLQNPFYYYSNEYSSNKKLDNLRVKNCRFFFDFAQMVNVNPSGIINNDYYSNPLSNTLSNTYINWEECELYFSDGNGEYVDASNQINPSHYAQLFNMDPTIQTAFDWNEFVSPADYQYTMFQIRVPLRNFLPEDKWRIWSDKQYVALLGHNLYKSGCNFALSGQESSIINVPSSTSALDMGHTLHPINFTYNESGAYTLADGYSITPYSQSESAYIQPTDTLHITFVRLQQPLYVNEIVPLVLGCISYGEYYDIPITANFGSKINFDYDESYSLPKNIGEERQIINNFQGPPPWTHYQTEDNRQTSLPPWTLSEEFKPFRGRRRWELEFGGILEDDLFPDRFDNIKLDGNNYNKEYKDTIYTKLITQLPNTRFMFMPDANDPHNIAICKLDGDVKITKQTHGIYNISLNVREVW